MEELKSRIISKFENVKEITIKDIDNNSNGKLLLIDNNEKLLLSKLIKREDCSYIYYFSIIKSGSKYIVSNSILYYLENEKVTLNSIKSVLEHLEKSFTLDEFISITYDYLKRAFYRTEPEIFESKFILENTIENELQWRNYKELPICKIFDKEDKKKYIEIKPSKELKEAFNL
ncbi:MAG: hypothetical protein GX265_06465 [Mollicutes bacterium]|nr:hypothetical protein [Mollicutes bacterium]